MKIFVAGDYCPKDRIATSIDNSDYSFFDDVKSIVQQSDYSIVNFECPIVDGNATPISKSGPALRTNRKAVDAIQYAGFSCATLANNHFRDYGDEGCKLTIEELSRQGIDHVGGGSDITEAQKVLYKTIGGKCLAIVNFCENEFSIADKASAGSAPLDLIDNYHQITEARRNADYVLVIVHGGHEMYQLPSPRMKKTYRHFVDIGADAVINHHQHCFSGYEYYNNKPIVYGLGNFCFDWNGKRNSIWNEGFSCSISFNDSSIEIELHPYIQCNDAPSITFLVGEEANEFFAKILGLNSIIESDTELAAHFGKWIASNEREKALTFAPWHNRYLNAAARRGLLPILLSEQRAKTLLNHINCEAHRDITTAVLRRKIK